MPGQIMINLSRVVVKLTKSSAISTYGGQGATKRGCKASEHTIVHFKGTDPVWIPGERARGMTKEPIMIEPTDTLEIMQPFSRLRCGKIYSIEWNVKVRDIGMVASSDKEKLLRYYKEGLTEDFDLDDDYHGDNSSQIPSRYRQTPRIQQTPSSYPQPIYRPMPQPSANLPASSEGFAESTVRQMSAR
jgi:hypothetical protein